MKSACPFLRQGWLPGREQQAVQAQVFEVELGSNGRGLVERERLRSLAITEYTGYRNNSAFPSNSDFILLLLRKLWLITVYARH